MSKNIDKILKKSEYIIYNSDRSRRGGNGQVFFVKKNNTKYALKFIELNNNEKKLLRTTREIDILKREHNFEGIIPIIDSEIVDNNYAWYTMPISTPIDITEFSKRTILDIVTDLKFVAETLKKLHEKNIYHRDIKPQNLLYLDNKLCLGDFGLVTYPEAIEITKETDRIGPWTTIPPEHKRNAKYADNKKGDIYSFGKTMWILLTGNANSFDGQYSYKDSSIRLLSYRDAIESNTPPLAILDDILIRTTENQPEKRPTIDFVIESLEFFIKSNHSDKVDYEWKFIAKNLFPYGIPTTSIWNQPEDIVMVLNEITYFKHINHLFFKSGGLDFNNASLSTEIGYIELNCETLIRKLKPKSLRFESFEIPSWNYFLLELDPIDPEVILNKNIALGYSNDFIELIEINPGEYIPHWCFSYKRNMLSKYKELLPETARNIALCLNGTYIFCSKTGEYNAESSTYNGYQQFFSCENFRNFIKLCIITNGKIFKLAQKITLSKLSFKKKKKLLNLSLKYFKENKREIEREIERETTKEFKNKDLSCSSDNSFQIEEKIELNDEIINKFLNQLNLNKFRSLTEPILYEIVFYFKGKTYNDNKKYKILENGTLKIESDTLILDSKLFSNSFKELFEKGKKFNKKSIIEIYNEFSNIRKKFNLNEDQAYCSIKNIIVTDISNMNLATEDELNDILKNGDSFVENTLVVDLNGTLKLIPNENNSFEISLYPIQIAQFDSYQNEVGEFYNDNSSALKHRYKEYLNYYYQFITTNKKTTYVDYYQDINTILKKIQNNK